jgi:protein O-mannosyl-transferase
MRAMRPRLGLAVAGVAAAALAASVAGLGNQFVQDDTVLIAENARVHTLASSWRLFALPYWPPPSSEDLYRPLMSLLTAVEYGLGAGQPLVFRVLSCLLYAGVAVGVLRLARRLLPERIALAVALLFAAHPVHVEAVALGVGQNELLVGLLATIMTIRYLDRRRTGDGRVAPRDWAVLAALFVAASLLKEQGFVLPGLLLAAELLLVPMPDWRRAGGLVLGYLALMMLGLGVLAARAVALSGDLAGTFMAEALEGQGVGGRALTMLRVAPEWARLLVWPLHLRADYSPREMTASTGLGGIETLGLIVLSAVVVVAWAARRRAPTLSFGLVWAAVSLFPVSNVLVPTGILLAERTLFLPSIGAALALGALAETAIDWDRGQRRLIARTLALAGAVLVIAGAARSAERERTWRSESAFVTQSARDAPDSWRTERAYGQLLFTAGDRDAALAAYQRAIALVPPAHAWRVRNDLARRFWEAGANELAVEQLRVSLLETPDTPETRYYLILAYLTVGAYADARREADAALAQGLSSRIFGELRAVADRAEQVGAPPGSLRIRVGSGTRPPWSGSPDP